MKTKTAQIHIEQIWGTANSVWVVIRYRGRNLVGFDGHKAEIPALVGKAQKWAKNQGFTLNYQSI
jgi:hypothetical protein